MAFGIASLADTPVSGLAERAGRLEAAGFDQLWLADERLLRNVYVGLAAMAAGTQRSRIGPSVTNPYTRHPALTAAAIATVDELSGGRAVLALGAGGGLEQFGIDRVNPVGALREATEIVRRLTAGEKVNFTGQHFTVNGAQLGFPWQRQIPVYIAARGPRILELAGQVADGVIIGGFAQPAGLAYAMDRVAAGLDRAGRGWADITCVSDDREAARRAVSRMVMASVITSRTILDQLGIVLPAELADRVAAGGWTYAEEEMLAAARLLPEEVVEAFAVYGTAQECARRLREIRSCGANQLAFVVLPGTGMTWEEVAMRIAREVLPQVAGDGVAGEGVAGEGVAAGGVGTEGAGGGSA
jgi:5,10-methylenetetrahydromethanopterin reductase